MKSKTFILDGDFSEKGPWTRTDRNSLGLTRNRHLSEYCVKKSLSNKKNRKTRPFFLIWKKVSFSLKRM